MEELWMDNEIIFVLIEYQNRKNTYFLKLLENIFYSEKLLFAMILFALQIIKCNKMKIIYDATKRCKKRLFATL